VTFRSWPTTEEAGRIQRVCEFAELVALIVHLAEARCSDLVERPSSVKGQGEVFYRKSIC